MVAQVGILRLRNCFRFAKAKVPLRMTISKFSIALGFSAPSHIIEQHEHERRVPVAVERERISLRPCRALPSSLRAGTGLLLWRGVVRKPSSFARLDSRGRLSPHEYLRNQRRRHDYQTVFRLAARMRRSRLITGTLK